LAEYLVGTGGWAYFPVPEKPSLKAYSEVFSFVEVNYTFYEYPGTRVVELWRKTVPKDFTFAVRCHKDLTHVFGLKPVDEAYEVWAKMIAYCRILDSPFLVLETPASYVFDRKAIDEARDFFSSVKHEGIKLVWEVRASKSAELANLMRDHEVVHSVDLSREEPMFTSDVAYSRLFGKGKHNAYQFTDEELVEIDEKALKTGSKIVAMSYHGIRMSSDAVRFMRYKKTGSFPAVTSFTGPESARAVLSEDAVFPSTKQALIEHQGWKVVDATPQRRIHLSDMLSTIPEKKYGSLDDVVRALETEA
jgi:uncharacterized protein YecE (DUF72 family)